MKGQSILLAAMVAGTLFASEMTPDEIKRQNQYVEYRLMQGEIYRICVKMNDGVTTVQFPSAITEIAGKNVSADGKGADFLIQAHPGSSYFNVTAIRQGASGTLTITYNRKLYILYLVQSDSEAFTSVVFGKSSNRKNLSGTDATVTPKVSPGRLVSLIDLTKKYDVLAENHPDTVSDCERVRFQNRYRFGKFDMHLLEAVRFEAEDTVIFHVLLENLTDEEIAYDKHSFSAHTGNGIYYMSVSDASGLMPPKSKTHAWFGITSTSEGGRNNLKADNDWLLALTTKEMHTSQLQSVEAQAKAEEKRMKDEAEETERMRRELQRQQTELDEEKADFARETEKIRAQLQSELDSFLREKAEFQKKLESEEAELREEKKRLQESEGIMQTVEILRKMREETRDSIKSMRERSESK